MRQTTNNKILEHIRKYQTATVKELSTSMRLSGADIRHHLATLEINDQIEIVGARQEGRGRPRQVYGLSQRVLGDGLDTLSDKLLAIWEEETTPNELEDRWRSLANKLAGSIDLNLPIMRRVNNTVTRLNRLHYQARWEASVVGPRLILGHCPYSAIITEHPQLCLMDAFLLERNLGSSVGQTAKLQLNDKGLPFCAFIYGGGY